jgi:hypothetical protein
MHEYERQWSRGGGHAVRHPLRLKMERLAAWCGESDDPEAFERRLEQARRADDIGQALLAEELLSLWRAAESGGALPFPSPG